MDLLTVSRTSYESLKKVPINWGTDTLLWTERFQPVGDFELTTQNIRDVRQFLPERSMCTLRDTHEVMWVDSHAIDETSSPTTLTVKGRTLDWFLMNRIWANNPYGKKLAMAKHYTVRQALETWVWNAICNGTGNDRINTAKGYPAENQLPNVVVTDSIPASTDGDSTARQVISGDVYTQMMTFLASERYGVRIIRPSGTKGRIVHIDADGTFNTDSVSDISDLRFDFYNGRDVSDKVVFNYKLGHLSDSNYAFSSETLKTGCFVDGDARTHYFTDPDTVPGSNSGWNRMDAYVDGGSKATGVSDGDFEDSLKDMGMKAVRRDGAHIDSVDAEIRPGAQIKYGKDYRLGDKVMVQGRYGAHEKKWVTEVIRAQDKDGYRLYPTLSSTLSSTN
jgi:hypothetical protein